MLLDFWYPLAFTDTVTRTPRRVTALGRELVVWRTRSGRISVLSDLCVHRGGALSAGRVNGETITCPYHGWGYGADGACTRIPAQPRRAIPAKARVDSYPVTERYGIVWGFLGDLPEAERPPLPVWPEYDEPGWRRTQGVFDWSAGVDRVVEGGIDFSHGPFVHRASFGRSMPQEVPEFDIETTEWSGHGPDTGQGAAAWFLPSSTLTDLNFGRSRQMILQAHLPVDEGRTHTFWVVLRNFVTTPLADPLVGWMNRRIMREDRRVVQDLRPELLPFDLSDELHIRSDVLQVAYRRRRRELVESGWPTVGEPQRTGAAEVIASPARRDPGLTRSWVHRPSAKSEPRS